MLAGALDREMFRIAVALPLKFVLGLLESSTRTLLHSGTSVSSLWTMGVAKGPFIPIVKILWTHLLTCVESSLTHIP